MNDTPKFRRRTPPLGRTSLVVCVVLVAWALVGCPELPNEVDATVDAPPTFDFRVDPIDFVQDTSQPQPDMMVEGRTTEVDYDSGHVVVSLDVFSWRLVPDNIDNRGKVRTPPAESGLRIEYGPSSSIGEFSDPRRPIDDQVHDWQVASSFQLGNGPLTLTLEDVNNPENGQVDVMFSGDAAGIVVEVLPMPPADLKVERIEFGWSDDGGPIYGGGLHFDHLNLRGHEQALFRDFDAFLETGSNNLNVPIPFILNPRGYSVYFESMRPGLLDLGVTSAQVMRARFNAPTLKTRIWNHSDPDTLLNWYTAHTSRPKAPPAWALAPQVWRSGSTAASVLADAQALRDADIPVGGIWLSDPWQGAYNDFWFNAVTFPDPVGLMSELAALGFDAVAWVSPYLNTSDDSDVSPGFGSAAALYAEADVAGLLVGDGDGAPRDVFWRTGRLGGMLDFTNDAADAWWRSKLQPLLESGVRGLQLERGSDVIVQDPSYGFADGSAPVEMQARYGDHANEATLAALTAVHGDDAFLISSSGSALGAAQTQGNWPMGLSSTFGRGNASSLGGLESSIIAGVSTSLSGHPFYGSEVGGAQPGVIDGELLLRWTGASVYSPLMQIGHGHFPWIDSLGYSTMVQESFKDLLKQRMRLTPYLEVLGREAELTGAPLMRPIAYEFPDDRETWEIEDAYMLGPDLMVAPITAPGATSRVVYLPDGNWRDFNTGQVTVGPADVTVSVAFGAVPAFAREGSLIPLRLDHIDTLGPASDPDVVSAETADATMHVRSIGQGSDTVTLTDGTVISMDFDGPEGRSVISFSGGTTTRALYVELVGVVPALINCSGLPLIADDSIAIIPVSGPVEDGFRQLTTGTLLLMGQAGSCDIVWR